MTGSWSISADRVVVPAGATIRGALRPPGSKSLTHRAYAAALLARKPVTVTGAQRGDDAERFLVALEGLGFDVHRGPAAIGISPPREPPLVGRFDCGASGTLLRFLTALLTTVPGEWTVDGTQRLRERPMTPLVDALRQLGARVDAVGGDDRAPYRVRGGSLRGGRCRLDAGGSSQFLSALLLAGQGAQEPVEVELDGLVSAPYVDLTVDVLEAFGGRVERRTPEHFATRPATLRGGEFTVEPDLSAAAYPAAAAALTGGEVRLEGVHLGSRQGDRRLLVLLEEMGAEVEPDGDDLVVAGRGLDAIEVNASDIPDQVPTLAALAPFARGVTRITNVAHLRTKESDRLAAMAEELRRAGAEVEELPDGLVVPGAWAAAEPPFAPVFVEPHDDHRIAMAMSLVGLRRAVVAIRHPEVVEKSWPGYWQAMAGITGSA